MDTGYILDNYVINIFSIAYYYYIAPWVYKLFW